MKESFLKQQPFAADFIGGGLAGAFTGMIVAPAEALKVEIQCRPNVRYSEILFDPKARSNMLKAVRPFATIFSAVCALEFSVNERIKHNHGQTAGVVASALTGSGFLTVADHIMFRGQRNESTLKAVKNLFGIRATAVWTGFTPMAAREAIFITSVMYLGPKLGEKLRSNQNENSLYWNSVGRLITGVTTTLLSQPFDVMAREMQMQLHKNPEQRPTMLNAFKSINSKLQNMSHIQAMKQGKHPLFNGALPRIGLATFGGMLAGGFFQQFRSSLDDESGEADVSSAPRNKLR